MFPDIDSLVNTGTGENYGIEMTVEKRYSKGFYLLSNVTLYNSTYTGGDGIKHNTAFNGKYTVNLLCGYEFKLNKKVSLEINGKVTFAGGKRYPKIDLEQSNIQGETVIDPNSIYELKYKDYFRADLKIGLRVNGKKTTQLWAFDVQNITNRRNIFRLLYDQGSGEIKEEYQIGFFPVVLYKITF